MALQVQQAMTPWLDSVKEYSTRVWEDDFELLFRGGKTRFGEGTEAETSAVVSSTAFNSGSSSEILPSFSTRELSSEGYLHFKKMYISQGPSFDAISRAFTTASSLPRLVHSDVQINVPTQLAKDPAEFFCHSFILRARSSHFHHILSMATGEADADKPVVITLPETFFTQKSLFSILGYIYTGTLKFMQQRVIDDLETAFDIYRGSIFLALPSLQELMLAQLSVEFLHGLFHARFTNSQYSQLVDEKWTNMAKLGCRCQECAHRAPRVLQFAFERDMENDILERGARRAMIGLFGEGWCTEEFAALPQELFKVILFDIREIITPFNIFPLLLEAERVLPRLNLHFDRPEKLVARIVRPRIISVRKSLYQFLYLNAENRFASDIWKFVMKDYETGDRSVGSNTLGRVGLVLEAIFRGATQQTASDIIHDRVDYYSQADTRTATRLDIHDLGGIKTLIRSNSSVESFDSSISASDTTTSLEEPTNLGYIYSGDIVAFNVSNNSLVSLATSRTASTDYGMYWTRWAISQETIED